jgi:hypothetical protein
MNIMVLFKFELGIGIRNGQSSKAESAAGLNRSKKEKDGGR